MRITCMRSSTLFIVLATLTGCSATGPKFSEVVRATTDSSVVYVYRVSSFAGGGSFPKLKIDGKDDVMLKNGGYIRRVLPAGLYRLVLRPRESISSFVPMELLLSTEKGKTYFVRYKIQHLGADSTANPGAVFGAQVVFHHKFAYTFGAVDETVALAELKETQSLDVP